MDLTTFCGLRESLLSRSFCARQNLSVSFPKRSTPERFFNEDKNFIRFSFSSIFSRDSVCTICTNQLDTHAPASCFSQSDTHAVSAHNADAVSDIHADPCAESHHRNKQSVAAIVITDTGFYAASRFYTDSGSYE